MPEAAVYEDSDLAAGERDVDAATAVTRHGPVDSVAESCSVQQAAQLQFRPGVAAAVGLHVPANREGTRPGELPVVGLMAV